MRACALIPVFNHAGTVADVVSRCRAVIGEALLVVDDGSTDGSGPRAEEAGARIVTLPENRGKGHAIRVGLREAQNLGYTHAVVIDADGQHRPEEIPQFLEAVRRDPGRIWVGVRDLRAGNAPVWSRRGRAISNFWVTVDGWQRCLDAQSGMRAYPISETLALGCREERFAFEIEVLIRASWAGLRLGHLPIAVHYPAGDRRISHFDRGRDNRRATWVCFTLFLGMVARTPRLLLRRR